MNPEVKELWVNALNSGDYEQGTGTLRMQGNTTGKVRWCCLGVLCDLAIKAGVPVEVDYATGVTDLNMSDGYEEGAFTSYDGSGAFLPPAVIEWAGLDTHNPIIYSGISLAMMNDHHHPFDEIAEAIEENL